MISTKDLRNFAKYRVITTARQSDGAKLIAIREVIDEKLPVRWDDEVIYSQPQPSFIAPVSEVKIPLSTSQLIKKGQEERFGNWYPIPEDAEPDTTDYLVD